MQTLIPCRVCGQAKDKDEFYPRQIAWVKGHGECKECTKERVRNRARTNPAVQAYDRARAKLPHRRLLSEFNRVRWRTQNPQAYKAQTAVSNAVRDGKLKREPCKVCGRADTHAHHHDYAKPLDVEWLCPLHHHRLHADDPSAEGKNKTQAKEAKLG